LIVHSFGRDYAPYKDVSSHFLTQLALQYPEPVEFLHASLEMTRFDGPDRDQPLLDYLRAVYPNRSPDLIVPIGAQAGQFSTRLQDQLFPHAPLLLLAADRRRFSQLAGSGMTIVGLDVDLTQLLRNILQIQPLTQEVYFVSGTSPLAQFWQHAILQDWRDSYDHIKVHTLDHLSLDQVGETLANLPPHSAVFVGIINRDAAGVSHEAGIVMQVLRERSNAPVFGYAQSQFGQGIVGGALVPTAKTGKIGAEMGARILAGESSDHIPPVVLPMSDPVYDWRELHRWNIPEEDLPPNSTVLHREPTTWEQHRTTIIATVTVLLVQSALVILLLAARQRARETDASLKLAADAAAIGLWRRRPESNFFTATPRCRSLWGFPLDAPLNLDTVMERIHAEDRVRVQTTVAEAARTGRSFSLEHRIVLPDKSVRWLALHGRTHAGRQGDKYGTQGAVRDITAQRETETRVEQHQRELAHLSRISSLGVLSAAITHEVSQPLGSILHNAQAAQHILAHATPDLGELGAIMDDIVSDDKRAGAVVKRLRNLMRRGDASLESTNILPNVEEVLELMRKDLRGRSVQVDLRSVPDLPPVLANRVQLQQVLINLIANACDAMDENPPGQRKLTVELDRSDQHATIAIRDQGPGLPDDADIVFEPFHTTKPEGLGMGLAICRTIINAHQGSLEACNHEDGGAVFQITLPQVNSTS
jgi:signal transduction histidine kinase